MVNINRTMTSAAVAIVVSMAVLALGLSLRFFSPVKRLMSLLEEPSEDGGMSVEPSDEFDFIAIWGIDKNEPTA